MKNKAFIYRRLLPLLLAVAMLFGITMVAVAANGDGTGGGGNNQPQTNMAGGPSVGDCFQLRVVDPDIQMENQGGTYSAPGTYDSTMPIRFTLSLNPCGNQKEFSNVDFTGVIVYEKGDSAKTPVVSIDHINENARITTDPGSDVTLENLGKNYPNERQIDLIIPGLQLKGGTTYCLYFPSSIKVVTNGKTLGVDVTVEFTTDNSPSITGIMVPHKTMGKMQGVQATNKYGFAETYKDATWDSDKIAFEVRINPLSVFATKYAEENYKQFSVSSYYGDEMPVNVEPGRSVTTATFYKITTTLGEPGWYALTVGKDLKNDAEKTIGDYTGGENQTHWIFKPYYYQENGEWKRNNVVELTTNLENISYEDASAYYSGHKDGTVEMDYIDPTCPDYLVKLTAAEGYALPSELSITVNGKELTKGKDYTYTPGTLQTETGLIKAGEYGEHQYNLKVDRHAINGPVVIKAAAVKPVTGVALDKTELTLDEQATAELKATVSPEDATIQNVTWSSSDEAVATVDENGKVTAVKAGTATITVTTEDSEKTATCTVTVNHVKEVLPAVEPTCTEPGKTEGEKCKYCGEILKAQEEIPAKGHTEEVVKGKAATCTEKGLTDGKKCSVCGEWIEEQKEIPALGHDFKDGKCTRCDAEDPDYVKPVDPIPVEPDNKFTGLANEADKDGVWWYYTNGKIDKTHTGVDKNKNGWWRVENGKVNFKAQGIYQNQYGWWKTTDGEVTFKENSIYQNEYGWWKCKDSKVDFTAQSIYQNKYGWWKTTDGEVTFKENGLFKNQYGTWKVENSKVNFNFNGTYQGKTIKNGKVQ